MDVLDRDFFTDPELLQDPTPWYVALRERGPVWREPQPGRRRPLRHRGGPPGLRRQRTLLGDRRDPRSAGRRFPSPTEGESWAAAHRASSCRDSRWATCFPPSTLPGTRGSARCRGGSSRRIGCEENEAFMKSLADELIDEIASRGEVEFNAAYARPFTLLVIADLLGVPREDHPQFRALAGGAAGQRRQPRRRARGRPDLRERWLPTSPATSRSVARRRVRMS